MVRTSQYQTQYRDEGMNPEIEHEAVLAFRAVLRRGARDTSPLSDMRIDYDVARDHLVFHALFAGELNYHWSISMRRLRLPPWVGRSAFAGLERDLRSLYSRMYEDHLLQLELEPRRRALYELERSGARRDRIEQARDELRIFEEHVRRHHRHSDVRYVGVDHGRELLQGQRHDWVAYDEFAANDDRNGAAETKGLALLKSWLTPEQLACYESQSHFEVIGSDTGKRYRIRQGRQMNIDELDAKGKKVCGWCFLPEGGLVAGDCMLAQKIALETNETAALKVANKFGGGIADQLFHAMFGGAVVRRPGMAYVETI